MRGVNTVVLAFKIQGMTTQQDNGLKTVPFIRLWRNGRGARSVPAFTQLHGGRDGSFNDFPGISAVVKSLTEYHITLEFLPVSA